MNVNKRNKIQAKLDCPATPEPEREVCRKILGDNPAEKPANKFYCTGQYVQPTTITIEFDYRTLEWIYSHHCNQCDNYFADDNQKSIYCPICLAAKRKEAEG